MQIILQRQKKGVNYYYSYSQRFSKGEYFRICAVNNELHSKLEQRVLVFINIAL